MSKLETQTSAQERILTESNAIWIQRGLQATRLLQKKEALKQLADLLPNYDDVAQKAGTVSVQKPQENSLDTVTEEINFTQLLAERNDLLPALQPHLQTVQKCIDQFYKPNDEGKPTCDTDLQNFLSQAFDSHPYQHTLETFYKEPFDTYLHNAVQRLEKDKKYVPTDAELKQCGKSREETIAVFERAIEALKSAYDQLALFQLRAKAVHEAVLPKLQEHYKQCADRLAAICTEATAGIIDNPKQYFAPQQENRKTPDEMSLAFTDLRWLLMGLRSTDGRGGLSHAMTADENYIASFVQSALSKAGKERQTLEKHVDRNLLQEFDASLTSTASEAPAQETDTPSSSVEVVQNIGKITQHRSLINKLLRRKR